MYATSSKLRPMLRHPLILATGAAAAALIVAGCGAGGAGNTAAVGPTGQTGVTTHTGSLGTYLTDSAGRTLYVFSADKGSKSMCSGACAQVWHPFTTHGSAVASGKASTASLATATRADGGRQVTYAGHPLYYFAGDQQAGQVSGQGLNDFGGHWWAVSPGGKAVITAAMSGPSYSGGGYGYGG